MIELEPFAWQEVQGKQSEVQCRYVIDGATVRLLVEDYDRSRPLVIDPVMIVSTDAGPSRYDPVGNIYQAVCSPSPAYPTTANAFSPTDQNDSYDCIGIKIEFQQSAVTAAIIPSVTLGCSPLKVSFQNNSTGASQYQWSFGDGSTDNGTTPTHTFTSSGTYTVTLIAINPASCNGADTAMTVIQVVADPVAAFSVSPANIGLPGQVFSLTDLSTGATQWEWTFGDGTSSSNQNPQVSYSQVGTYDICLRAISPGG